MKAVTRVNGFQEVHPSVGRMGLLGGIWGSATAFTLLAMLLSITLPLAGERDMADITAETVGRFQYVAVGALNLGFFLSLPKLGWSLKLVPLEACEVSFGAFMLACAFSSAFGVVQLNSLLYVGATVTCYLSCYALWRVLDPRSIAKALCIAGIVYVLFAAYCLRQYGIGIGRLVGRMTPNHFAAIAGVGAMCCQLGGRWVRLIGGILGGALVVIIVARGMVLALAVFFLIFYSGSIRQLFTGGGSRWLLVLGTTAMGGLLALTAVVALSPNLRERVSDYFELSSVDRGIGSGMTGRYDTWARGWNDFMEAPLLGHGFRSIRLTDIRETSHSSYIDLVREVGLVGAVTFAVFLVVSLHKIARAMRYSPPELALVYRWTFAVLIGLLILSTFEINLLSFAFPTGALIMLTITSATAARFRMPTLPALRPIRAPRAESRREV